MYFERLANRCSMTYSNIVFALFYCASLFWGIILIQLNVVSLPLLHSLSIVGRYYEQLRIYWRFIQVQGALGCYFRSLGARYQRAIGIKASGIRIGKKRKG